METTEAEVVRNLAFEAARPAELEPGKRYAWLTAGGMLVEQDLGTLPPNRKTGTIHVSDVASFAAYYERHADQDSEVFADLDHAVIVAVLDAHQGRENGIDFENGGARWQQHRLVFTLQLTEPWKTWTEHDRDFMPQLDFAEFLEDNFRDLDPAGPVKGADLLTAAQKFEATIKVEYGQGTRLQSGDVTIRRIETTEQTTGKKGYIEFPEEMDLRIRPYTDCDEDMSIAARLRYRAEAGGLKLGYFLNQPERVRRDAVQAVVTKAAAAIDATIMLGRPAS